MDFGHLLQILARRKWLIFGAMLATGVAVFFLIGRRPEHYKASVLLSTGIVNYKGINSDNSDAFVQQYQVENAFSNLIEFAQSRSSVKILTLHMLKHDLNTDSGSTVEKPFRKPNLKLYGDAVYRDADALRLELARIQLDSISDPAFSQELDYLIDRVSRAYGYDNDAILRNLAVKRKGATDYLLIEVKSENAQLSQYMANAYVSLFTTYYHNLSVREKRKNVIFYRELAKEKRLATDTITNRLYAYLESRGLPNLGKQSEDLVNQLRELRQLRTQAESKKLAAEESMDQIQGYIDDRGALDAGETRERIVDKYNAADLSEKVRRLTEESVQSGGKDPKTEAELAGARQQLDMSLRSASGSLHKAKMEEARRTKEDLFKQKVQADVDRIEAEKSIGILNQEIQQRTGLLGAFVVNDKIATNLQNEQKRAEEEFTKVNNELIEAKLRLENSENPLKVIENAQLPEWPEPNRQVLLSIFASVVVGTMVVIGLFMLAYFDNSLKSPDMFRRYTDNLPLLGAVQHISLKALDFNRVFSSNGDMPQYAVFREDLRKLRNALQKVEGQVFLFVSTRPAQGKTFTAYSLAHALAANHKYVLMIDTNFKTPIAKELGETPSTNSAAINRLLREYGLEDQFQLKKNTTQRLDVVPGKKRGGLIDVVAHTGPHQSPAEMLEADSFRAFLRELCKHYDYIFLEAAAINQYSDAQELAPFADKVVAVFNAATTLNTADKGSLEYLRRLNTQFAGAILTDVDEKAN